MTYWDASSRAAESARSSDRQHGPPSSAGWRRPSIEPFIDFAAGFAVGARLAGCTYGEIEEGNPAKTLLLSHAASQSWASLTAGTDEHELTQYGPRRLWDELEAAYDWWVTVGRPDCARFGLTVTAEGQAFWLDSPDQLIPSR